MLSLKKHLMSLILYSHPCKGYFLCYFQDGSGTISPEKLLGVMRAMGQNPTEDELLNLVLEVDIDGNGTIEFEEFLSMMKQKANEQDEEADLRLVLILYLTSVSFAFLERLLRYLTVTRMASSA